MEKMGRGGQAGGGTIPSEQGLVLSEFHLVPSYFSYPCGKNSVDTHLKYLNFSYFQERSIKWIPLQKY